MIVWLLSLADAEDQQWCAGKSLGVLTILPPV